MKLIRQHNNNQHVACIGVSARLPETPIPVLEKLTRNGFDNTGRNKGKMA